MDGAAFDFDRVNVVRDGRPLLEPVDAVFADHGVTVIVGPSGSGKSTLLRLCNRLSIPTSGVIRFNGADIADLDPLRLRREVGMVFQRPILLPGTVADNLREAEPRAGATTIEAALGQVGLAGDLAERAADSLSGGEAQRVCIARTLMAEPRFVLFDEPTSSLDAHSAESIEAIAADLAASGTPSAWVTHDLDQMLRLAHQLVVVVGGRVVQQGHTASVLAEPVAEARQFFGEIR